MSLNRAFIARSIRLRGKPSGTHAQEPEAPVRDAINHRAQANARQRRCVGVSPNHKRIDESHHRRSRIGQHDGPALREHTTPR